MSDASPSYALAVVGYAGRFPGAPTAAELWENLVAGVESIVSFTAQEALAAGADPALVGDPGWIGAGGLLDGIDRFDPAFFGFTPREAAVTDPQHRLFLECAWEALESAGAGTDTGRGVVGVWAGTSASSYLSLLQANPEAARALGRFRVMLGNDKDHLATWTAYKLNLRGPAVTVQTACSTSLVAVHLACQSLLNGEIDLALAGGVSVAARQKAGYVYVEGGINSPDGHCRAFDAAAQGTVGGSGVAVVVLKRLDEALAAGDPVRAVILGSAVNNDGSSKVGFTAPSVEGQARVIGEALAVAGVDPATLEMVEAHGTGTPLGDPVELEALTRAFRARSDRRGFCALGSIKTNIGHLDAAAGAAGLIKAVLALEQGRIPPSLHFQTPNPRIDLAASPFVVPREALPWVRRDHPRRAGVSSFGIGGTNAHVVLEEVPATPPSGPSREVQLLLLSARSAPALEAATARLVRHLREHPEQPLGDVTHTLRVGRRAFEHRRTLVCRNPQDALTALDPLDSARVVDGREEPRHRPLAFLFPGQGSQIAGMGSELARTEPVFRRELDRCAEILFPHLGLDVREGIGCPGDPDADERLAHTELTQPALFAVEWSLAQLWMSWGVQPEALLGHSIGQWVAACLAGVFSLADACALVALRGHLLQRTPPGVMLAVRLQAAALEPLLPGQVVVTAINAPDRTTVAGPAAEIAALAARLDEIGVLHRRLRTSHAFHTPGVEPVLHEFRAAVAAVERSGPRITLVSDLTGDVLTAEEATDPDHWTLHLRTPVRFADGLGTLLADPSRVLLEVGPGASLCNFARRTAPSGDGRTLVASLAPGSGEPAAVLGALADLWRAGVEVDWQAFVAHEERHRLALPTYPFQRQSCWVTSAPAQAAPEAAQAPAPPAIPRAGDRRARLREELFALLSDLVGVDARTLDPRQRFLEAGIDSLLLIQAARVLEGRFGIGFTVSQLLVDTPTLESVIARLDAELPAEIFAAEPGPALAVPAPPAPLEPSTAPPATQLERIFAEQLRAISEVIEGQLAVLRAAEKPAEVPVAAPRPATARAAVSEPYVPFEPIDPGSGERLSGAQRAFLTAFIDRFTHRTAGSKQRSAESRGAFADNRNTSGFRLLLKEMVYPIVVDRARGGRLWDVDGNEYVDITMGFGVHLFGHSPELIDAALRRQLDRGMALGPQSDMAGEAARRFCALTGQQRVAFCNSGTEAVLFALRLARTATGRDKIALFAGSYHGIADATLARAGRGAAGSIPVAPGIPRSMLEDVLVFPYGEASALDAIAARAGELAAVLVEPVQSRRPDLQPAEFLRALRRLTAERGIALVFDEVITGLRSHPGGAQALFGVSADLATYGKVLGGGMPIGAVAGRAAYMDGIDGGDWQFGDDSFPRATKTYFAGTFCKHPLTMAATLAVLEQLQAEGPALQEELTRRTAALCARIDAFCEREGYPLRTVHFSSLFRLVFPDRGLAPELFYAHLLERGVYLWEGRTSFLSTAHTQADLDQVVAAVADSLATLRAAGFFPEPPDHSRRAEPEDAAPITLPLTEGQRQIWFVAQLGDDASRAYNEAVAVTIAGPLDTGALARALARLAARHDSLRLVFDDRDGKTQTLLPRISIPLPDDDLEGGPAGDLERLTARVAGEPFDLAASPPVRARLVRLAAGRYRFFLTLHHLIVDGWSFGVLLRELARLYRAERRGEEAGLPPAPRFRDFACRNAGAPAEPGETAAAALPALELPLDAPRPPVRTFRGGRVRAALGADLASRLRHRGAESGATLTAVLLAGFAALAHRLGAGDEVAVGVAAAGQVAAGAEGLVGYCIDLLPVCVPVAAEQTFSGLVARAAAALGAAREASAAAPARRGDASRLLPLAAVLNLDKAGSALDFDGLPGHAETLATGASKFELYLNFVDGPKGLDLDWEFAADLFLDTTIARWAGHLGRLLAAGAELPGTPLAALPLLAPAERHQLLSEWNDTAASDTAPAGILLHHLLADQAVRDPEATAVTFEGDALSYAGLDRAANRLARHLRGLGVGPEVPVGVCLDRSLELVVSLLAVLKAGGAYVPLDPSYPAARLAWMLEDLPVPVLLTRRREAASLPGHGGRTVLVDEESAAWRNLSETAPSGGEDPDQAAYVIFTSGSTGRPKGVVNTHRGIVNRLLWMQRRYGLGSDDRVLQKTPFSFDVSVWELFWPLLTGAGLVVARPDGHRDGAYLAATIEACNVTTLHFVPSMLAAFLEEPGLERLTSLRRVIASGEALPLDLARRFHERLGGPAGPVLENLYGPTEAAVDVTFWPVRGDDGLAAVPIGRPVANTSIHLFDAAGHPVPLGVAGELFIGGIQVARGYAGRPGLTAERFVPDPMLPGGRLYRTGDLARRLPGGALEFLGRLDHQVKVRGVRIELGEIEAALLAHPDLREAVVIARRDAAGEARLVAFISPRAGRAVPAGTELRAFLAASLPETLVPSLLVPLANLPLSPNGKADRAGLARLDLPEVETDFHLPPRTPLEEMLAGQWAAVLGRSEVGRRDNFFELGGHSLHATRLVGRLREVLGIEVPLRRLFESPTVEALARWVEGAEPEQGMADGSPLVPVPRNAPLPLSFAQERLWFLDQLQPGLAAYNLPLAARLTGALSPDRLAAALTGLVARHEALRTRFSEMDGTPVQTALPAAPIPLGMVDLCALPERAAEAEARRQVEAEAARPFDLASGLLLRALVMRLGGEDHLLAVTVHHIAADGWSLGILLEELGALYRGASLPELPIQYADYAVWQRSRLDRSVLATELAFWREQLAGAPPLLELPTDRPRPPVPTTRGAWRGRSLAAAASAAVHDLARDRGATPFMVLAAALQVLLARWSGQDDVTLGTPVAGRLHTATEPLIGCFLNTLVLRARLEDEPGFDRHLARVRETALAAFSHQEIPFDRLVAELAPERDLGTTPIFQVMLVVQNTPPAVVELPGLRLAAAPSESPDQLGMMTLSITSRAGLVASLGYNRDLFDAATMERFLDHFEAILAAAAAHPEAAVSALPLASPAEMHQVCRDWNDAAAPVPDPPFVHLWFERQARATPNAAAVIHQGLATTYAELDLRARRLARRLQELGAGPEARVGICAPRSPDLVAALLAVLKTGAAYVPVDLRAPAERKRTVFADAEVIAVLTAGVPAGELADDPAPLVRLDDPDSWNGSEPPLYVALESENLAYVLYTSGSTGTPKGALIPHSAVANIVSSFVTAYRLGPEDRVLQQTTIAFDVSVNEIFPVLAVGGAVVLLPEGEALDFGRWTDLVVREEVTIMGAAPSLLARLNEMARNLGRLRLILSGGEALAAADVNRLLTRAAVVNGYGPTETTVACLSYPLSRLPERAPAIPIGRPIANDEVFVLDRRGWLAGIGIPGELVVGGAGLARGYLGLPALTAERFVPHPLHAGERVYRTGDRARWLPSGDVEFLGRFDQQVKIRGVRIEPGEIEAALATHPAVAECAVAAREDRPGQKRLVAYVALRATVAGITTAGLRAFLADRLPEAMVPAAWVVLDRLPLSATGKVDRKALPPPASDERQDDAGIAPRSALAERIAFLWSEVLEIGRVADRDDFFAIGGHSLLATRLVSRLRESLAIEVPVRTVFEHPVFADFAKAIAGLGEDPTAVPLVRRAAGPAPLSFAQERLWFLHRLEPESPRYNMPTALRFGAKFDAGAFAAAVAEIVRRHEVLRTTYHEEGAGPVQVPGPPPLGGSLFVAVLLGVIDPLPLVDLTALPEGRREAVARDLAAAEAAVPFDLERGPVLRVHLLRLGTEDHVALLTVHHIACDAWSADIFERELAALTAAAETGQISPLAPLQVQVADHAAWQRAWFDGEVLAQGLAAWRRRLEGAPGLLDLPLDRSRPPLATDRGDVVSFAAPAHLAASLSALGQRQEATLFMILLASWGATLSRLSGQEDVVVGTPVADRDRAEVAGLIGCFLNTLPLRLSLAGAPSFIDLLARARTVTLDAWSDVHVPFDRLVGELAPDRSLQHAPIFQTLLTLNHWRPGPKLDAVRQFVAGAVQAKVDISLMVEERGGDLRFAIEFNRDLLDRVVVRRWADHLLSLLAAAAASPELPVTGLPLVSPVEAHQLTVEWNDTGLPTPAHASIAARFIAQAAATPDAVAVAAGTTRCTYGELADRSSHLARRLRAHGAGPGSVVALCVDRTLELPVAVLGALCSGAAYVPLDPFQPVDRLRFLLADSGAELAVSSETLPESALTALAAWGGPVLPAMPAADSEAPGEDGLLPEPAPSDLAYLIYTSGSSGQPKAVMIEHGSLAHVLQASQIAFSWRAGDVLPCLAPASFDIFLFELLNPLLSGGTVHLVPLRPVPDVEALLPLLAVSTHVHAVPALMRLLVDAAGHAGPERFDGLREIFTGGDAVPADLLADLRRTFPLARLRVLYGPTEGTIICSSHRVPAAGPARPLLGRPLGNVDLHVRDAAGQAVPLGVAGELWIGGPGVARGYLHRDELTAAHFPRCEGRRFYRTGDRARRLSSGELEFLGRADQQVKLRGFRIELGEVEAALAAHPAVVAAVATVEEGAGGRSLVAFFVVAEGETPPQEAELRAFAARTLPDYMVPAAIQPLAALPLSSHGKVDRRALPRLDGAARRAAMDAGGPLSPAAEVLAVLWSDLLGVAPAGPQASFFDLGGHSLLAARLVSRVREAFAVQLPVRAIFETPVLGDLARRIEELQRGGLGLPMPPPMRRAGAGTAPLSFAQERLWFLQQLDPEGTGYNIPLQLRLRGRLRRAALLAALTAVVGRHEALRTRYLESDGNPIQIVDPARPLRLPLVDLTALPESRRDLAALSLAGGEAGRRFDLAQGPVLRALLLRLGTEEHAVLLTLHHIAADGWSIGLLVAEVAAFYSAAAEDRAANLPALPVQYADFAVWQRAWMHGEVLDAQLAFWRRHLAAAPELLALPLDHPRPAVQSFRGGSLPVAVSPEVTAGLAALARHQGATLFMVALAAFRALLARLSGQDQVVIGTASANRHRVETERLIGLFVNTLALRGDLSGDPDFGTLLSRAREDALNAFNHDDLPLERLVAELAPQRSLAHTPLFQAMLVLQNVPHTRSTIAGLTLEPLGSAVEAAKFDLSLNLAESGGVLTGTLAFDRDLFDSTTARRWASHLDALLAALAAAGGLACRLSALPLLTAAERAQIAFWNDTEDVQPEACIHDLFAAQAARTPAAPAVLLPDGSEVSYGRLAEHVLRLARFLRRQGVGPDVRVGVCLERSLDLLVALLGVLSAGAAYVPLDPAYPGERLRAMIEDGAVSLILSDRAAATALPSDVIPPALLEDVRTVSSDDSLPLLPALPGGLAYVLFTSGSTGRPKGVLGGHRGVVNRLLWLHHREPLSPADRVLLKTPYSFDVSIWEMFGPLLAGACLVLVRPGGQQDSAHLAEVMAETGVTVAHFVASMLSVVVEEPGFARCRALRLILTSGEALSAEVQRRTLQRTPARLLNLYGPTEASIECSLWECRRGQEQLASTIGRPIANCQLWVVDSFGGVVPVGVAGELQIGGEQLARGYAGRPELTAERFVPDPFGQQPGGRLYRSGDLCRHRPDGTIEFLGRTDFQVKVRGVRIELGEIESVLGAHPAVLESVVLARRDGAGDARLVAYVVPAMAEVGIDVAALREHLESRLPAVMIPSAIVTLAALPLSSNGKIDRAALPAPEVPAGRGSAPRDEIERGVAAVWEDLLGVGGVSIDDDFFALGGHSLLAVRLMARLRREFTVDIPLATLFEAPNIEKLARRIRDSRGPGAGAPAAASPLVGLQLSGSRPPFLCIHPVGGEVLIYRQLARRLGPEQPFYGLQAPGLAAAASPSIEEMAARYVEAVLAAIPSGPYLLGGWSFGCLVAYEMALQLTAAGHEVALVALFDGASPGRSGPRLSSPVLLGQLLREEARQKEIPFDLDLAAIAALPVRRGLRTVVRRAREAGILPEEMTFKVVQQLLAGFRRRLRAADSYRPQQRYPGRLTLFRAALRDADLLAVMAAHGVAADDPTGGWTPFSNQPVEVHSLETHHDLLLREPAVGPLADQLAECILRALDEREADTFRGNLSGDLPCRDSPNPRSAPSAS